MLCHLCIDHIIRLTAHHPHHVLLQYADMLTFRLESRLETDYSRTSLKGVLSE